MKITLNGGSVGPLKPTATMTLQNRIFRISENSLSFITH